MALRVTGGTARGLRLKSPTRRGTRPTTDRIRSALFSILQARMVERPRVLDLYAGTGALGIEALSRGAAWADFVERNPAQCVLIQENLSFTGFADRGRVYCGQVERLLSAVSGPYDLVLLDPPYEDPGVSQVVARLGETGAPLTPEAVVCLEHVWLRPPETQYGRLALWTHRRYGDTGIAIYSLGGSDDNGSLPGQL